MSDFIVEFQEGAYAAKWGISDLYDTPRAALERALGDGYDFDTGQFGAKKEIEYGRIVRQGDQIEVTAWCYDDFDTEGKCSLDFSVAGCDVERMMQKIENALEEAIHGARIQKTENEVYEGFSVGHEKEGKRIDWVETYIAPKGDGVMLDSPPGDYYAAWGWQEDSEELPQHVREKFEEWIQCIQNGLQHDSYTLDGWMIERWAS